MALRVRKQERGGEPRSLADMMESAVSATGSPELMLMRITRVFRHLAPVRVVTNSSPIRFAEGTLLLHCTTSAWASELVFMKGDLVRAIRRVIPELTEIAVRVGPIPSSRAISQRTGIKRSKMEAILPEEIARALVKVQDDGLRDAIAAAARASLSDRDEKP